MDSRGVPVVFLLLLSNKLVEGQFQVIGPPHPIVAGQGDDVILPCHVEPRFDAAGLTVEWSRPDLSLAEYVHVQRNAHEFEDMKMSSYLRRTRLFDGDLRHGNISLKIANVTLADEGRYKCYIPKLNSQMRSSIVQLLVVPTSAKTSTTETPLQTRSLQTPDLMDETDAKGASPGRTRAISGVVVCVLLILAAGVAAYLTWKCQQNKNSLWCPPSSCLARGQIDGRCFQRREPSWIFPGSWRIRTSSRKEDFCAVGRAPPLQIL